MNNYKDCILEHMSSYKRNKLGILENGDWRGKHFSHIIPVEQKALNLLQDYREELIQYIHEMEIKLHQYFHHLNSSQAVCLNFFNPLMQENLIHLLLQSLQLDNEFPVLCEFEKNFSKVEGTNFDFYIKLKSERQLFFEIKYTENEFGKVRPSEKYQKKYKEVYKDLLLGKINPGICEYEELINNYQLLRNILYIDATNNDLLIIICPEKNSRLYHEYQYVFRNVIVPTLYKNICFITWESMLDELNKILQSSSDVPNRLIDHYAKFREKYMIQLVRGPYNEKK